MASGVWNSPPMRPAAELIPSRNPLKTCVSGTSPSESSRATKSTSGGRRTAVRDHVDPAGLPQAVNVVPAAGERVADTDDPTVHVDEKLGVDAAAAVLPGEKVGTVPPVEGRDQRAVDQTDLAGDLRGQCGAG